MTLNASFITCSDLEAEIRVKGFYFSKALFEGLIFRGGYIPRGLSTEGHLRFKID